MLTRRSFALASLVVAVALLAAGCGNASGSTLAGGTPQQGGTLKLLGSSDVDHLDTAGAYYVASYTLERAFTRQLFSYPASTDIAKANTPVADVATQVPTQANGGVSADGRTWTIHLRSEVCWNTTPALGVDLGTLLGGVIVTEQVFGLPGLGQLAWQSVTTQDLPVIIGTVLVASAFIVVANLLVDLGYALLDPRVRPS